MKTTLYITTTFFLLFYSFIALILENNFILAITIISCGMLYFSISKIKLL